MKDEDASMFKLIQDKLGTKGFRYISCPYATIKLHVSLCFFEVCECGKLGMNFYSITLCNSAVIEF